MPSRSKMSARTKAALAKALKHGLFKQALWNEEGSKLAITLAPKPKPVEDPEEAQWSNTRVAGRALWSSLVGPGRRQGSDNDEDRPAFVLTSKRLVGTNEEEDKKEKEEVVTELDIAGTCEESVHQLEQDQTPLEATPVEDVMKEMKTTPAHDSLPLHEHHETWPEVVEIEYDDYDEEQEQEQEREWEREMEIERELAAMASMKEAAAAAQWRNRAFKAEQRAAAERLARRPLKLASPTTEARHFCPAVLTAQFVDHPRPNLPAVSRYAFSHRLSPTQSGGVAKMKRLLLANKLRTQQDSDDGYYGEYVDESRDRNHAAAYEFTPTVDFPVPQLSLLQQKQKNKSAATEDAVSTSPSPASPAGMQTRLKVVVPEAKKTPQPTRPSPNAKALSLHSHSQSQSQSQSPLMASPPAQPQPSHHKSARRERYELVNRVTLTIGSDGAPTQTLEPFDFSRKSITLRKPLGPQTKLKKTFARYPVHVSGAEFEDLLFDSQNMTLIQLSTRQGEIVSMVDVEIDTITLKACVFPDGSEMVTLSSPQAKNGYLGSVRPNHWHDILQKVRQARLYAEHFEDAKDDKERKKIMSWEQRQRILHDTSTQQQQQQEGGADADTDSGENEPVVDLSSAMTLFNLTSVPVSGEGGVTEGVATPTAAGAGGVSMRGRSALKSRQNSPRAPPVLSSTSTPGPAAPAPPLSTPPLRLLLIESREAMQVYFRIKLQPLFASIDVVNTLQESLSLPALHRYSCVFLHCVGIFRDPSPYLSMDALGARVREDGRGRREKGRDKVLEEETSHNGPAYVIKPRDCSSRRICVYGVPDYVEAGEGQVTGEEMLAFVNSLLKVGVSDILDEPFTYEQIQEVCSKVSNA